MLQNLKTELQGGMWSVCKIWSVDDFNLQDDLVELHSRLRDVLPNDVFNQHSQDITYYYLHPPQSSSGRVDAQPAQESALDSCCCLSHCSMTHQSGTKLWSYKALVSISELTPEVPVLENSASEPVLDEPSCDDFPVDNLSNYLLNNNRADRTWSSLIMASCYYCSYGMPTPLVGILRYVASLCPRDTVVWCNFWFSWCRFSIDRYHLLRLCEVKTLKWSRLNTSAQSSYVWILASDWIQVMSEFLLVTESKLCLNSC